MKIAVFGLGYVGSVSASCLAKDGHQVIGVDVNPEKVKTICDGKSPIVEPGLDDLIRDVIKAGSLTASLDTKQAVLDSDVSLICVGTPSNENGSLDVQYLEKVCAEIGEALAEHSGYHIVVDRSTVLPGTVRKHLVPILERHSGKVAGKDFGVCMNPEFLRESTAIDDYYNASLVVIGETKASDGDVVAQMYKEVKAPVVRMSIEAAEMFKYANNAFHALKVAFANEIGNLCKVHDIDGQELMSLFCRDQKLNISPVYLRPGFAFGGSCLPKDLRAVVHHARKYDVNTPVLGSILDSNQTQINKGIAMIEHTGAKRVGVLGLSFKPGTDDVRESPIVPLIETLVGRGFQVQVYDDTVQPDRLVGANRKYIEQTLPHIMSLMKKSFEEVVASSQVLVIANGSKQFQEVPAMCGPEQTVIDLVGIAKTESPSSCQYEGICW